MSTLNASQASDAVDLSKYAEDILAQEDYPLFGEAVECAKIGALRSAYVMIWLACAESIRRRFREAKTRDHEAGKVVGKIEQSEREHKAVDKLLLDSAHSYGLISDSGRTILSHIYEMRCVYAHPYEQAPSQEKVTEAAASVVELVLSQPVRLRQGFGRRLIDGLLREKNYLDDYEPAVIVFAKGVFPRIDESVHAWLLEQYWAELEKIADDPSMAIFFRRGIWFSRAFLAETTPAAFT